jgi:NAD(P)-dependent dehydrogenase (short-subunit alcohol dehydrogenase family)
MFKNKVALITGANRGIGFEISRQLGKNHGVTVILGTRNEQKGQEAAAKLKNEGVDAYAVRLDVANASAAGSLVDQIEDQFGRLDILVNNAGILLDWGMLPSQIDVNDLSRTLETNVVGTYAVTQAVLPLLRRSQSGRIVNLSSALGAFKELADPDPDYTQAMIPAYQISKAALNAVTVLFARELRDTTTKVNAADPGWVQTEMGTEAAPLTVEEGADTPVWLATLGKDGPTGGFFSSRRPLNW